MLQLQFNLSDIDQVARKIIGCGSGYKIWLFEGEMGSGKTTLIKAICNQLEVIDQVTSPTYSIVNEYVTNQGETIYHFDFYRIKHDSEALDIGVDEYFYSNKLCMIEWSERIFNLIPNHFIKIKIDKIDHAIRNISIN